MLPLRAKAIVLAAATLLLTSTACGGGGPQLVRLSGRPNCVGVLEKFPDQPARTLTVYCKEAQ